MGALKYFDTVSQTWKYITNNPSTSTIVFSEEMTGTVNGTNPIFTTLQPFSVINVFKNGVHMRPGVGNDYTITGANQITFAVAPAAGSSISASYSTVSVANMAGVNSFIFKETPTGLVNGTNGVFTTARPYIPGSLLVHINGITQGNLVTETNPANGTFTIDAPSTGDHISVTYQYATSVSGNADTVDGYHASQTIAPGTIPVTDANGVIPFAALGGAWSAYTPTFTGFTLGNGVMEAKFVRIGKYVQFSINITLGTTSSVTAGYPTIALPTPAVTTTNGVPGMLRLQYLDNGVAWFYGQQLIPSNASSFSLVVMNASGTYVTEQGVSSTVPMTWGNGDRIIAVGMYEAA